MTQALKGALLSGLVLPGLGQVMLKQYKRGIALMLIVLVALVVLVAQATQQALTILERIEAEGGVIDLSTISNTASQVSTASDTAIFNIALLLIIFCWIIGTIDAYRLGKKRDLELNAGNNAGNTNANLN
jgi:TM2 domain-containing membrane protein YozV